MHPSSHVCEALRIALAVVLASSPSTLAFGDRPEAKTRPTTSTADTQPAPPDRAWDKIEDPINAIRFDHLPFRKAIQKLADAHRANVTVDWASLPLIDRDKPVTVELEDVSFETALRVLLRIGSPKIDLDYTIEDEVIVVVDREAKRNGDYLSFEDVRAYDVRDLIAARAKQLRGTEHPERRAVETLVDLVGESVRATLWPDQKQFAGAIDEFAGMLVVRSSADGQREVANFLAKLRGNTPTTRPARVGP